MITSINELENHILDEKGITEVNMPLSEVKVAQDAGYKNMIFRLHPVKNKNGEIITKDGEPLFLNSDLAAWSFAVAEVHSICKTA